MLGATGCFIVTSPAPARQAAAAPAAPAAPAAAAKPATPVAAAPAPAAPHGFHLPSARPAGAPTATAAPVATVAAPPVTTAGKTITVDGKPVPTIATPIPFGDGNQVAGALQGLVYFIADNTAKFPNLTGMVPTAALFATQLNVAARDFKDGFPGVDGRFEWFAIRYTGQFTVPAAGGDYKFRVLSDDGAIVRVDDALVLDNDGQHPPTEKSGSMKLTGGAHKLQVDYFQGPRYQVALQLWVTPPGGAEKLWSSSL